MIELNNPEPWTSESAATAQWGYWASTEQVIFDGPSQAERAEAEGFMLMCNNCSHSFLSAKSLTPLKDDPTVWLDMVPGQIIPHGRCPKCWHFVYEISKEDQERNAEHCKKHNIIPSQPSE